jgi:hypothetical protein
MLAASGGEFRASDGVFVAAFLKVVIAYWKPKVEF